MRSWPRSCRASTSHRSTSWKDYAFALHYAQAGYVAATQPPDDIQATAEEAQKARDQLKKDATALAGRGLLDGNQIAQLKGGSSHKNLALDLEV